MVYTVNLDAIPASYDTKYITEPLRLDEQYQQIFKQKQNKWNYISTISLFIRTKRLYNLWIINSFSADFLDLIYLHNVIPSESPCAAIQVSVPTLNLLIIVIPTSTNYSDKLLLR